MTDVPIGCPRRMSSLVVHDGCPHWLSKADVLIGCPRRMSSLVVHDGCPDWLSKADALVDCPRRMSSLAVQGGFLIGCPRRIPHWLSKADSSLVVQGGFLIGCPRRIPHWLSKQVYTGEKTGSSERVPVKELVSASLLCVVTTITAERLVRILHGEKNCPAYVSFLFLL